MKFFSLQNFGERFKRVIERFPVVMIFSIACTVGLIIIVEDFFDFLNPQANWPYKFSAICALGVPLFFALHLWLEKINNKTVVWLSYALAFAFLGLLYITVPENFYLFEYAEGGRLAGYFIAFHLLVSFVAFIYAGTDRNFWDFNISTFFSFLESALYSFVLFLGLALALAAVENLFNVDLHDEIYADTFIIIAGVFHSFYFLSEIRQNLYIEENSIGENRIFKFFSKFILLPLTLIYFTILYAFNVKLLVEQEWSEGWISSLILGFSITGILTYLFLYYSKEEKGIIPIFKKWFFPALLPMSIVLFFAVLKRVNLYGVTEDRYIGFLTAFWLATISLYFIFYKKRTIKFIPISLMVLTLLSIMGPGNMTRIGSISQTNRLKAILENEGKLENGKLTEKLSFVSDSTSHQISSIIQFLSNRDRLQYLRSIESENVVLFHEKDTVTSAEEVISRLGLENYNPYGPSIQTEQNSLFANTRSTVNIAGYDFAQHVSTIGDEFMNEGQQFHFKFINNKKSLRLSTNGETITQFDLLPVALKFKDISPVLQLREKDLSFRLEDEKARVLFVCNFLTLDESDGHPVIQNLDGRAYIKILENE